MDVERIIDELGTRVDTLEHIYLSEALNRRVIALEARVATLAAALHALGDQKHAD